MARRLPVDAICRLIETLLPGGYPVIDEVAQLLQVSTRTFQRQISEEGLSYSGLVERCRSRVAANPSNIREIRSGTLPPCWVTAM